jgi:hypothetical protein
VAALKNKFIYDDKMKTVNRKIRKKVIISIRRNLLYFLSSDLKNSDIGNENISFYLRKSFRKFNGQFLLVLDISYIEFANFLRGAGLCKKIFNVIEKEARLRKLPIFVENVASPALEKIISKRKGYHLLNEHYPEKYYIRF